MWRIAWDSWCGVNLHSHIPMEHFGKMSAIKYIYIYMFLFFCQRKNMNLAWSRLQSLINSARLIWLTKWYRCLTIIILFGPRKFDHVVQVPQGKANASRATSGGLGKSSGAIHVSPVPLSLDNKFYRMKSRFAQGECKGVICLWITAKTHFELSCVTRINP